MAVNAFNGKYAFLSNFCHSPIKVDDINYPSVEHAFQAAKTTDFLDKYEIKEAFSPGKAKQLGRKVTLRPDWEQVKDDIMLDLVRKKFEDNSFAARLVATGDEELIEGNAWGDTYWGVDDGVGLNKLGIILMQVRNEIKDGSISNRLR